MKTFREAINSYKGALWVWLCFIVPALIIECLNSFGVGDFRFHRESLLAGEWWRLVTGHLDHLGWAHLGLNAIFLAVCVWLFKPLQNISQVLIVWLVSVLLISVSILLLTPEMAWYVGLSAGLYTLLIVGICLDDQHSKPLRFIMAMVVIAKVLFEQGQESTGIENLISGPVAEITHLYGVLVGLAVCTVVLVFGLKLKASQLSK